MGVYLDSKTGYTLYSNEMEKPYFVDKSLLLKELFPLIDEGSNYVCITRPRRFGKTVMTNMITAFFSRACDTKEIFQKLFISQTEEYEQYIKQFYAFIPMSKGQPMKGTICSYKDTLVFSFTSVLMDTMVQRSFFRKIAADGIEVTLETNGEYYE